MKSGIRWRRGTQLRVQGGVPQRASTPRSITPRAPRSFKQRSGPRTKFGYRDGNHHVPLRPQHRHGPHARDRRLLQQCLPDRHLRSGGKRRHDARGRSVRPTLPNSRRSTLSSTGFQQRRLGCDLAERRHGYVFNPIVSTAVEAPEVLTSMSAFPNPASSHVNVVLDGQAPQRGTWLDAQGRSAGTIVLQPGTNRIDVATMMPGTARRGSKMARLFG